MKNLLLQHLNDYLFYLEKIRHYSAHTIRTYKLNLEEALEYVAIEEEKKRYIINLIPYRTKLVGKNKKTIYKKVTIFRSFCHYLRENKLQITLVGDDSIKLGESLPKPIATSHIIEAVNLCNREEKLIVFLLYLLGLRISEVVNLKLENISAGWVSVKGKGDKIRQIPILDALKVVLEEYLNQNSPKVYLFEKDALPLNENKMRYKVQKIFKKIGIRATPHQLRHAFASDLLNEGARINDVSELLGHSSLTTTQVYTKLGSNVKMKNYKNAHPLCRSENESV
jgi:integrase/recombinase XerC